MDDPVTPRGGLVRCFAEFSLLPDLLSIYRPEFTRDEVVENWGRLLDDIGYNADHVEERFIPDGMTLTGFMADDALRFCQWIYLIGRRGALTRPGTRIANIAGKPHEERGEGESRTLTRILAIQTQINYRGANGLHLTDLLQGACAVLASHGQPGRLLLRGLLLAEMDTLLHWGFIDAATAESLAKRMSSFRQRVIDAMRGVQEDAPRAGEEEAAIAMADIVSELHWRDPILAQSSQLTSTELKATAMAMTFSQLLSHTLEEPQVLQPWLPIANAP